MIHRPLEGGLFSYFELMPDNNWAKEPQMYYDTAYAVPHNEKAEILNGRLAMLGFVAAVISYALTGHLFFGVI